MPDWVCEVLSPTTRRHNKLVKAPYYARVGVAWMWLVDLDARVLTVHALHAEQWLEVGVFGDEADARLAPFDAVATDVGGWWPTTA